MHEKDASSSIQHVSVACQVQEMSEDLLLTESVNRESMRWFEILPMRLATALEDFLWMPSVQITLAPTWVERMRREDRSRLIGLMIQMYDRTAKARLTLVEAAAKENSNKAGGKNKPSFKPLIAGKNIQVNVTPPKPMNQ